VAEIAGERKAQRTRLVALLGMLGSAFDGEVVNAAKLANALAAQLGGWGAVLPDETALEHELAVAVSAIRELLDLNDRLEAALRRERARTAPPVRWVEPRTLEEKIDLCCSHASHCTQWERDFLVSIAPRRRLSEKQVAVIDRIVTKVGRLARLAA
jgi:hypothetical protein